MRSRASVGRGSSFRHAFALTRRAVGTFVAENDIHARSGTAVFKSTTGLAAGLARSQSQEQHA
ncbi:hypothetical protein DCO57_15000 [Labrenzia sp. 011]|nr:hypothetical protein DCO57_15000 [Labrenzia sp. 011]